MPASAAMPCSANPECVGIKPGEWAWFREDERVLHATGSCLDSMKAETEPARITLNIPEGAQQIGVAMASNPEIEWIKELCRLQHPLLRVILSYPPSGDPSSHEIDAIVGQADGDGEPRIAVETTLCYRGVRAEGEAKLEEQILNDFSERLKRIATDCIDLKGSTAVFRIHFPDEFVKLRPRLHQWLSNKGRDSSWVALARAICEALRASMISRMAEAIDLSNVPSKVHDLINDTGNHVLARRIDDPQGAEWSFDFYEKHEAFWRRVITRNYGINVDGIKDAIVDKRQKLNKYRAIANQSGASQVWLLLVAEVVLGLDVHVAIHDENGRLNSVMRAEPQFDEIHLLAGRQGPPWKDIRL